MREISAGIIVYRKTIEGPKFLLLYHGRGYWNFAKGKIESEERSWQAAIREVHEETGLRPSDLKFDKNFKTSEKFVFWRKNKNTGQNEKVFKIVIFYLAETDKTDIKLSSEHQGYAWFVFREAIKILGKYKDSQRVLTQANVVLRRQQQKISR